MKLRPSGSVARGVDRPLAVLLAPRADRVVVLEREAERVHRLVAGRAGRVACGAPRAAAAAARRRRPSSSAMRGVPGGGSGGGAFSMFSRIHLPRSTGEVRVAYEDTVSTLACVRIAAARARPRVSTRRNSGPFTPGDAVVRRQPLVDVGVARVEQVDDALVLAHHAREEQLGLPAHREREAAVEVGEALAVGVRPSRAPRNCSHCPPKASTSASAFGSAQHARGPGPRAPRAARARHGRRGRAARRRAGSPRGSTTSRDAELVVGQHARGHRAARRCGGRALVGPRSMRNRKSGDTSSAESARRRPSSNARRASRTRHECRRAGRGRRRVTRPAVGTPHERLQDLRGARGAAAPAPGCRSPRARARSRASARSTGSYGPSTSMPRHARVVGRRLLRLAASRRPRARLASRSGVASFGGLNSRGGGSGRFEGLGPP